MSFLERAELVNVVIDEIVYVAPTNWVKIIYYTERLRDRVIGIRNKDVARCWIGKEMIPYNNSKGSPLKSSMELFDAVDSLYKESENTKEQWCGLGIVLTSDGKYSTRFYYEGTPLLDNNPDEYRKRLDDLAIIKKN